MTLDHKEEVCPNCHADWKGAQLDPGAVFKGYYGHREPCQRKRKWDEGYDELTPCSCGPRFSSRLVGIELPYDHPDHFDGVSFWCCPDCNTRWDRWTREEVSGEV